MTEALPAPLTPPDCDLSDFQYMELDVRRLRDSKFAAAGSAEGFRAGVLLWCAAWHQVPAASLPDDEVELANLAGYGRVVKEWRKVRDQALRGFVKCSDGRLYHAVISEKALSALEGKKKYAYDKLCERLRKENKKRSEQKQALVGIPTLEQWKSGNYPNGIPPETPERSAGIPPENTLKGNGEGEGEGEQIPSEAKASGATAPNLPADDPPSKPPADDPPAVTDQDRVYAIGVTMLTAEGVSDKNARSFLAMQCKQHTAGAVVAALQRCAEAKPIQAIPWLQAVLKAAPLNGGRPDDRKARQLQTAALMTGAATKKLEAFDVESRVLTS